MQELHLLLRELKEQSSKTASNKTASNRSAAMSGQVSQSHDCRKQRARQRQYVTYTYTLHLLLSAGVASSFQPKTAQPVYQDRRQQDNVSAPPG